MCVQQWKTFEKILSNNCITQLCCRFHEVPIANSPRSFWTLSHLWRSMNFWSTSSTTEKLISYFMVCTRRRLATNWHNDLEFLELHEKMLRNEYEMLFASGRRSNLLRRSFRVVSDFFRNGVEKMTTKNRN